MLIFMLVFFEKKLKKTGFLQLPDDDQKFSKRTPKLMARSYLRLGDPSLGIHSGTPTSKRIIKDVTRVVDQVYLSMYKNQGKALHGAHTCSSRRQSDTGSKGSGQGGKRKKQYGNDQLWLGASQRCAPSWWVHCQIPIIQN